MVYRYSEPDGGLDWWSAYSLMAKYIDTARYALPDTPTSLKRIERCLENEDVFRRWWEALDEKAVKYLLNNMVSLANAAICQYSPESLSEETSEAPLLAAADLLIDAGACLLSMETE